MAATPPLIVQHPFTQFEKNTALHLAAREGHLDVVTEIFGRNGDRANGCKNSKNRVCYR